MNQEGAIMCSTYSEITELILFITQCYNTGIYVHFLNNNHKSVNCYAIEKTQIIYIPNTLRQAAQIVINTYNEHFGINENDDNDDDNNDDDNNDDNDDDNSENNDEHEENNENNESDDENEQNEETFIDSNIAFTCPSCHIQTL